MNETFFPERLASLRIRKNVSAREMSLALGQNESYINRIENGHTYPSMQCFFYICEYLGVSPAEFFYSAELPRSKLSTVIGQIEKLNDHQLDIILTVASGLSEKLGQ